MNNPIQTMLEEHEIIQGAEAIIEDLKGKWETNEEEYESAVRNLILFFRKYADGIHHRKEEEVLFPAIRNHPDFILEDIIDELEQHHEDFREYTEEILEALANKNYKKSYEELYRYLQDLLDHIGAENDEVFVLAETLLDEDELETIYFKFKDIDLEVGEDNATRLVQMIQELAD